MKDTHRQGEETIIAITSLRADVKRYFEEPRQLHNMPDMEATFERIMERVLRKHTNQASHAHEICTQVEHGPHVSINIAERDNPRSKLNAALCGPHYYTERKFLCRSSPMTMSKTTSTANVQPKERENTNGIEKAREADHSYREITTFEILMDLGLWRRGLKVVIGRPMRPYAYNLDFRLTTYHIVCKIY